jgi:uncharacterized membrane protein YhhN
MTRRLWVPFLPFIIVSVVHLAALFVGWAWLATPSKWLLMPALLVAFLGAQAGMTPAPAPATPSLRVLGSIAILFSWAGDILISTPGDIGFFLGLGAFFCAHLAYLVLFLRQLKRRRIPLAALLLVVWAVALVVVLAPHLGVLIVPVALYGLALGGATAASLGTGRLVAAGAVLFLVSDTVLSLKMFLPGFSLWQDDFLIMLSYLLGQGLIAYGAVRMRRASDPAVA